MNKLLCGIAAVLLALAGVIAAGAPVDTPVTVAVQDASYIPTEQAAMLDKLAEQEAETVTYPEGATMPEDAVLVGTATVTHYCTCAQCCGKADGVTASGRLAEPGVSVAVDPAVIPLGAAVYVDYGDGQLRQYRADDTGGGVNGAHIDLCVSDHQTALELGVRSAAVYYSAAGGVSP